MSSSAAAAAAEGDKRSDFAKACEGEYFCVVRYVKVLSKQENRVRVQNVGGDVFSMDRALLEKEYYSATQYTNEEKRTRGDIAHLFEHAGDIIFTVAFRKKPDANVVADKLAETDARAMPQAKRRKFVRDEVLQGELRTLVGRLLSHRLDDFGRMEVIDLEKNEKRLVDPRTIEWLIYKNVKYMVK